jgi:hypothetical protein
VRELNWWIARFLVPLAALGLCVSTEAIRFAFRTPSLIDDWFGVTYAPSALHSLLHGTYAAAGNDFDGRYRPAWAAIWNYAQWHLLGRPSTFVAASWGVLRAIAFFAAILLLARIVSRDRLSARRPLLFLAPVAVTLTPNIAVALAEFGPGEPLMVAGLAIGLVILADGVRKVLSVEDSPRMRVLGTAEIAIGYLVYVFGVYTKESSVALLVFVPFFLKWSWASLRVHLARHGPQTSFIAGVAILILAPLLHVATRLGIAILSGATPWPNPKFTLAAKIYAAAVSPLLGAPGALGTWFWLIASPFAIAVAGLALRRRDRNAWLLIGVLATGFCMTAIPSSRGPMSSWYYIPWITAVAAVSFPAIAHARRTVVLLGLASVALLIPLRTPAALANWARTQRSGSEAIDLAKGVVAARCPLYLANFDIEQRVAIPLLFRFGHPTAVPSCAAKSAAAYAVSWKNRGLPADFAARCRSGWRRLPATNGIGLYRCASLRAAPTLDQYQASGEPTVKVIRVRIRPNPPPAQIFQPLAQPKA